MTTPTDLSQRARMIPENERGKILKSLRETELHRNLKEMYKRQNPDSSVHITHGSQELGKDLVITYKDAYGDRSMAVVVKSGNVTGKTSGRVDEIVSQVRQAHDNPAEIPSRVEPFLVDFVWVVIAGEISQNARKRLESEWPKGKSKHIRGLERLVGDFTEYYPEVFFQGQVADFLQKEILRLETSHLFAKRGVNLSEFYVDPLVSVFGAQPLNVSSGVIEVIRRRRLPFSRLRSAIQRNNKIVIVGEPGIGKTTALASLALEMLKGTLKVLHRRKKNSLLEVPFFVTARQIMGYETSKEMVNDILGDNSGHDQILVKVLLVDALDETPSSQRGCVLDKAQRFSTELDCGLVLTSRMVQAVKDPIPGFRHYELLPFEFSQALRLIENIVTDERALEALKDGLNTVASQMTFTPLSIKLLIEIAENHREIPASLTELYEQFSDYALGRFDADRGIEAMFQYALKEQFLAELAYSEFFLKDQLTITPLEFENFLTSHAQLRGWEEPYLRSFVDEVERAGLLSRTDFVAFNHRSFLDYFVAKWLQGHLDELTDPTAVVIDSYFSSTWSEVAFFYVGLMRRLNDKLLNGIFNSGHGGMDADIQRLLVGRLLQAGWASYTATKRDGIERALGSEVSVREGILDVIESSTHPGAMPRVLGYFFPIMLAEVSFSSAMLAKEGKTLLAEIVASKRHEEIHQAMALLWALRRFLDAEEMHEMVDGMLGLLSGPIAYPVETEAVILKFLELADEGDGDAIKTIRRRFRRLGKLEPQVLRRLFPPRSSKPRSE